MTINDLKSLSLTNTAKLIQTGENQTRTQEVPNTILTGGNFCLQIL